jgi:hypothetical protein
MSGTHTHHRTLLGRTLPPSSKNICQRSVFLNTEPFLARMSEVKIITPLTSGCALCVHVRPDETDVS